MEGLAEKNEWNRQCFALSTPSSEWSETSAPDTTNLSIFPFYSINEADVVRITHFRSSLSINRPFQAPPLSMFITRTQSAEITDWVNHLSKLILPQAQIYRATTCGNPGTNQYRAAVCLYHIPLSSHPFSVSLFLSYHKKDQSFVRRR